LPSAQYDDTTNATYCHSPESQSISQIFLPNLLFTIKIQYKMNRNIPDLSYFKLLLTDFLRESHPERLDDERFISVRSEAAAEACEQAIRNGDTPTEAAQQANNVLFKDLHFSKHHTLVNILWNEFAEEVPEYDAKPLAIKLLPECESVFAKYPLSDDFAYLPEYELLYTELTGTVALHLESHIS
jgi:hypothetical protein